MIKGEGPSFMPTQGWHRLSLILHHIFKFYLLELYLSHMQIAKTQAKYCCNHVLFITLVADIDCFPWAVGHRNQRWIQMGFFDP